MKSVDTNVLARFFVDDPDDEQLLLQRPRAVAVMAQRVYVTITVLLEFEWVLRGFYEFPRGQVVKVLRALLSLETVTLESRVEVQAAVDACADHGIDFADALHAARSARCTALVTFDRRLAKRMSHTALGVPVEMA